MLAVVQMFQITGMVSLVHTSIDCGGALITGRWPSEGHQAIELEASRKVAALAYP